MARIFLSRMIDSVRSFRVFQSNLPLLSSPVQSCQLSHFSQTKLTSNYNNTSILQGYMERTPSLLQVVNNMQLTSIRTNIRCHFPRPSEHKRITKHGWKKRMSTLNGRKIIMRRILKGRHVLSH